uniref:SEA domain-containing protein n=1 Tax=Branchiostoma floridae TaxID=7739 RepID=C3YE34_BRAFL|eukprot:XP_002605332.1 hypothetical protein BRAFLDRAFT_74157 [Branchiostoma floridae]
MDTVAVFLFFLAVGASHSTGKAATTTNATTTAETTTSTVMPTENNTTSAIAATTTGTNASPLTTTTAATGNTALSTTSTVAKTTAATTSAVTNSTQPLTTTSVATTSTPLLTTASTATTATTATSSTQPLTTTTAATTATAATSSTQPLTTTTAATTATAATSSTQPLTITTAATTATTSTSSTQPLTITTAATTATTSTSSTQPLTTTTAATTATTSTSSTQPLTTTTAATTATAATSNTQPLTTTSAETTTSAVTSSTQPLTTSSSASSTASTTKSTPAFSTPTTASTTKTISSITRTTTTASAASTANTTTTKTTEKPTTPKITIPPKDPEKPSKIVAFQLSLDGDFTQTLNDSESSAYQELERSCVNALTSLHTEQRGFQGVRILGFRSGSIVVRYIVIFEDANLAANEDITSEVETLIKNGNLTSIGNYTVNQSSFREIDISIEDIIEAVDREDLCHGGCTDGKCNLRTAYGVLLTECVCLDNHCKNGGQCSYEDGPKCRCNHDPTGFYTGDRCEFYASQPLVIGLGAGVGGLLLIIIITLSICLCCRRRREEHDFGGAPLPDNAYWTLYDTMSVTNKTEDTHDEMPLHSVANKRQVHFDNSSSQEENSTFTTTHLANQDKGRVKYQVSSYAAPTWERPTTTNHSFLHGDLRTSDGEENPTNGSKPGVRNVSTGQVTYQAAQGLPGNCENPLCSFSIN